MSTVFRHQGGSDPSAVVFDGLKAAVARKVDIVLIDTAGRFARKEKTLIEELKKLLRVIKREISEAPHEKPPRHRRNDRTKCHRPGTRLSRSPFFDWNHPDQTRRNSEGAARPSLFRAELGIPIPRHRHGRAGKRPRSV